MFPIDEEYGMLSFFNISTPLWSEVTIVLLLSNIITISYNERLFLIGLLLGLNYAVSRIIIRRLKNREYVNIIITKFDLSNNLKYNSFLYCLFLLFVYTVIPIVPIVLYFILQWSYLIGLILISTESYGGDIPHSQNAIFIEECIQLALLNSNAIKIQNSTQQINELNLASSLHSIKPSFSISFSPLYNQSINSVTQPDGSIRNIGVQHASGLLSFNTSIPLSLTGGNISISQSVNYYRYINRNSSYENFGVNLYQVSYSQPLSFFRRNKFIKQTAISNYKLKTLKKFPEILKRRLLIAISIF